MSEWCFFVAPLAVLAAVSLFYFVGCQSFSGVDDASVETTPTPTGEEINYVATVKKDSPVS